MDLSTPLPPFKILVSDDEALARARIRSMLEELGLGPNLVGEACNGHEVLSQCESLEPDVVLLDICMPGMSGLEAARHIAERKDPPAVIFTTAYDEHALQAFETNAVDYLVKPIRLERLKFALEKAASPNRIQRAQIEPLREDTTQARSHLTMPFRGGLRTVAIADIIYFRAEHKYVNVRHTEGESLIEDALRSIEKEFAHAFVRIHRNALVARSRLAGLIKDSDGRCLITLRGVDETLEVSRRHAPDVRRLLRAGQLA